MPKYTDVNPCANGMYWCNYQKDCYMAEMIDKNVEIFRLWTNRQNLEPHWTPSTVKLGWSYFEEFAEKIDFYNFP